ncbi:MULTISPECIES: hypothetical protein [Rhizobium]|uniref:hypothetical protein n=1 Tax=unclassified Rhizobium TaxID=2613769 RepID=UPI00181A0E22|nr:MULTISPECIES: hypothetical protein [unclassified Rhizobium]MBB3520861.1 hypothetical protein [Rhizobium sp. BK456]MDF0657892.1 hypothetical protein [Rhizobium sp. BC49]ULJ77022.1 hypothetical protein MF410_13090 [Rhizobium sp. C104]
MNDALPRLSRGFERRPRIPRQALTEAVVSHLWGAEVTADRLDLVSFVFNNKAAALILAKAELACKSWRIAPNSVLAARLVWSKDPWGGCGSSP